MRQIFAVLVGLLLCADPAGATVATDLADLGAAIKADVVLWGSAVLGIALVGLAIERALRLSGYR